MIKGILLLYSVIGVTFCLKAQIESHSGIYTYGTSSYYSESINLIPNGSFSWSLFMHGPGSIRMNILGNWQVRNDSLILDSHPQRDKIIVNESRKGKLGLNKFTVTDKNKDIFTFHLTAITQNGDTIRLRDQWKTSKVKGFINGFYITNTSGVRSPFYCIKGKTVNAFDILFEHRRVFENEAWLIKDGGIVPKGLDGEIQQYTLKRQ